MGDRDSTDWRCPTKFAECETDASRPTSPVEWQAWRWHLGPWDMWFLASGRLLSFTVYWFRRRPAPTLTGDPGRG
jgi:hypothetical protein